MTTFIYCFDPIYKSILIKFFNDKTNNLLINNNYYISNLLEISGDNFLLNNILDKLELDKNIDSKKFYIVYNNNHSKCKIFIPNKKINTFLTNNLQLPINQYFNGLVPVKGFIKHYNFPKYIAKTRPVIGIISVDGLEFEQLKKDAYFYWKHIQFQDPPFPIITIIKY